MDVDPSTVTPDACSSESNVHCSSPASDHSTEFTSIQAVRRKKRPDNLAYVSMDHSGEQGSTVCVQRAIEISEDDSNSNPDSEELRSLGWTSCGGVPVAKGKNDQSTFRYSIPTPLEHCLPVRPPPTSSSRPSPYSIPLPLASAKSATNTVPITTWAGSNAGHSQTDWGLSSLSPTPVTSAWPMSAPPARLMEPLKFAPPIGGLSTSRRRQPPAWPSTRAPDEDVTVSHRTLIAKSAGLTGVSSESPNAQWSSAPAKLSPRPHGLHPYTHRPQRPGAVPVVPSTAPLSLRDVRRTPPDITGHPGRPREIIITPNGTLRFTNVSQSWVVGELNANAPKVWFSPETSDCRLGELSHIAFSNIDLTSAVPLASSKAARRSSIHPLMDPEKLTSLERRSDPCLAPETALVSASASKQSIIAHGEQHMLPMESLPAGRQTPVLMFPLHRDYLVTQSRLLRLLLVPTQAVSCTLVQAFMSLLTG